jgi:transcriptional regulator with XRE-family HTH domain
LWLTGILSQGAPVGLFLSLYKNLSSPILHITKDTYNVHFGATGFYFSSMKKKKPGPARGQKHEDVKRSLFGERLFRARKARSLSQQELGAAAGLSKRMVSRYEGDFSGPPMDTLARIAQALDVTVSYLLGESTQKIIKDDISPNLRKHVNTLKKLPPKEQKTILNMIEIAAAKNNID